ncbi:C4-dicarboxylate transporter DctA [Amycolatopsis acidicola]|uniref:C4-dicarboxylate transporter DctA n=1 Tax=Amycolatopsis acidicola TaxID=2596893 RepID=A0A5N0UP59_9PSEU|nr:C4-dicarboxylate transporter DctA [Amycolatopsis acidicola]KAA9152753.1 C4-dicarboxylate transporter DctA [Amycolatopsis acidicola]
MHVDTTRSKHPESGRKPLRKRLRKLCTAIYFQVIVGIAVGILVGRFWPHFGESLKPLGDVFISMIKMLVAPIIFITVVLGICGAQSLRKVGRVGLKALIWFEIGTTLALVFGLVVGNIVKPGSGINADTASLNTGQISHYTSGGEDVSTFSGFLSHLVPTSAVGAFADGNILQVLFLAVFFGIAMTLLGKKVEPVKSFLDNVGQIFFRILNMVMRFAPIGAFGAMSYTIATYGLGSIAQLGSLIACMYATAILFVLLVLGSATRLSGLSIFRLLRYIRQELLIGFGTASSESVLPQLMRKLEHLGISRSTVGLTVPSGYSFNLDGTAIYLTLASLFIAQATNTHLPLAAQISLLVLLVLTSKGGAGVAGAVLFTLAATLEAHAVIPVAGLALILGIDRFLNEARTLTNIVGNTVASVVVARWDKDLDVARARRVLRENDQPSLDDLGGIAGTAESPASPAIAAK